MFNFLLDTTTSDGIPGGVASGLNIDSASLILGIIIGVIVTLVINGIIKYAKWLKADNKKMEEMLSQREDK